MTARTQLFLPIVAARSVDEYLADHDGDASAALRAARADVAQRERQNTAARRFRTAFEPAIRALGIDPELGEDTEAAAAAATTELARLRDAAGSSGAVSTQLTAAHDALRALGIDPERIQDGLTATQARLALADEAGTLRRQNALSRAATALGFDDARLTHVLRDEQRLPELRRVRLDGAESETDEWVIPGEGDAYTLLSQHPSVAGFEVALRRAEQPAAQPAVPVTPVVVDQPPASQHSAQSFSVSATLPAGAGSI